jgi:hypothetical protein
MGYRSIRPLRWIGFSEADGRWIAKSANNQAAAEPHYFANAFEDNAFHLGKRIIVGSASSEDDGGGTAEGAIFAGGAALLCQRVEDNAFHLASES